MTNNINYLYDIGTGIELIFCDNSTISYPLHNHISVLTIGMVLDGSLLLTTNQGTSIYNKNQTFTILPYIPHSISANENYTLLSLCIEKKLLQIHNLNIVKANIINLLTDAFDMNRISGQQIVQLLNCLNLCTDMPSLTDNDNAIVDIVKKQLELHPEGKISIQEMAQTAFISKYHFIRSFKQQVGLTPHQFQIQNRIRKAQRLIGEAKTITEVALNTGFCDQSHFIKQFEKYVGLTPSTYKLSSGIFKRDTAD